MATAVPSICHHDYDIRLAMAQGRGLAVMTETQNEGDPVARNLTLAVRALTASVAVAGFVLATGAAQAAALPKGDAKDGASTFQDNCAVCHSFMKGAPAKIGPNLFGVVGRKSATQAGYMYSPAMMKANLTWDVPTLSVYLMGPQKVVPGTKMGFPGFSDPQDEADVIAYLQTLK
jgi:cytochrome c